MKLSSLLKRKAVVDKAAEREAGKGNPDAAQEAAAPMIDFRRIAEDFKTLDPKDPGLWPVVPRATILVGLFAGMIGAAWWFGWNVQMDELAGKTAEESTLKEDWLKKKQQAVNLDAHKAQLAEINTSFGALLKQLPNQSEIGDLLVDVNKVAQSRGLVVELFKPGGEAARDFYAEVPITLQMSGGYHEIGGFAGDVAQLSRIVTLNDIDVSTSSGGMLLMKTTARTFRYLDEDEIARTRQAQKGAKRK